MRWNQYLEKYSNHPNFIKRHLRMPLSTFYLLLSYIREELTVDFCEAQKRGGPILPEICLFCTLQWLSGASYLGIVALTGVSVPSMYRVVYHTLKVIINCKKLDFKFPKNEADCLEAAKGFKSISQDEAIVNCIGVVDGYLLRTYTPKRKEAGNVRSYFSGHYKCHGINIQAVCDHHSRFTFFGISSPGSVNDCDAIKETGLLELLEKLS
jgi:DDE superfamily endonuclease